MLYPIEALCRQVSMMKRFSRVWEWIFASLPYEPLSIDRVLPPHVWMPIIIIRINQWESLWHIVKIKRTDGRTGIYLSIYPLVFSSLVCISQLSDFTLEYDDELLFVRRSVGGLAVIKLQLDK